jgi:hypothetical protein
MIAVIATIAALAALVGFAAAIWAVFHVIRTGETQTGVSATRTSSGWSVQRLRRTGRVNRVVSGLVGLFFIAIGLVFVGVGAATYVHAQDRADNWSSIEAQVVSVKEGRETRRVNDRQRTFTVYRPTVRFQPPGRDTPVTAPSSSQSTRPTEGSTMDVRYRRSNPTDVEIDTPTEPMLSLVFAALGGVFVVLGAGLAIAWRRVVVRERRDQGPIS